MFKATQYILNLRVTGALFLTCPFLIAVGCTSSKNQAENPQKGIADKLTRTIQLEGDPVTYFSIKERMQQLNIKGFSAAIVQNGVLVDQYVFGTKNNKPEAVDANTLFQAASISKPITALGILKLAQENRVDLDKDINGYLKGYRLDNPFGNGQVVTLRNILNHSAGLNVGGFGGYPNGTPLPEVLDIIRGAGNSPKIAVVEPPNSRWNYSGGGYLLLGKIIEDITGLPFHVYIKQEILDPLGMTMSSFQQPLDTAVQDNFSFAFDPFGKTIAGSWHNYGAKGAGGLWTNPTDLAKYCIAMHKAYQGEDNSVFQQNTIELMVTPGLRNWGLGPLVVRAKDGLTLTHDGSNAGFKADMFAYLESGNAAIAMANSENGADLCREYLQAVCSQNGWGAREPFVVRSIALDPTVQSRYLGVYEWLDRSTYTIAIIKKGNRLTLEYFDDGQSHALELEFMDEKSAIHIETGQLINFRITANGAVSGLLWRNRFEFVKREGQD